MADEVEWLLPTPKASDGIKGSPNQRHGNGDLTLPSAAASLLLTQRSNDTHAPQYWGVFLPLWTEESRESEEQSGDGARTQRPFPDGRG
ncbi:hypothetical protein ACGFYT_27460 [Streptomyces sp. NPDC048208]|uniref:hypothetical protein n=1 Tax=Streptomyces sp. NPDC048208 TaxID=3365515 RepID=UPI003722D06F